MQIDFEKAFLRDNGIFFSRLGCPYYRVNKKGETLYYSDELSKYLRYHKQFLGKGVNIHTCILHSGWVGVNKYDYTLSDKVLDELMALSDDLWYIPRIKLDPPLAWCKENPGELFLYAEAPKNIEEIRALVGTEKHDILGYESPEGVYAGGEGVDNRPNVGGVVSMQSFFSDVWRKDAEETARRIIQHIESKPYAKRVIGYMFCFGPSGENLQWGRQSFRYGDYSQIAKDKLYQFGIEKYGNKRALAKAWKQPNISAKSFVVPTPEKRYGENSNETLQDLFRGAEDDILAIDWDYLTSNVIADLVIDFCHIVKTQTKGKYAGSFYGYFLECGNANYAGHLQIEKLLNSSDVDFLAAPFSYQRRADGDSSGVMTPTQSVNRKKLWLDETDLRTYLTVADVYKNSSSKAGTNSSLWREACKNMADDSGFWWMDLGGGWFDDEYILNIIKEIAEFKRNINKMPYKSASDVLIVTDENSLYYMKQNEKMRWTYHNTFIGEAHRSGVLIDVLRLSDIVDIDLSQYKLIAFAFNFVYDSKIFEKIRISKDTTVLYNYTFGIWKDGVFSLKNTEELTGFKLEESGKSVNKMPEVRIVGTDNTIEFKTIDGQQRVLNLEHNIKAEQFREIARKAGCHVYTNKDLVLYGDKRFLYVLTKEACNTTLYLPNTWNTNYKTGEHYNAGEIELQLPEYGYALFTNEE